MNKPEVILLLSDSRGIYIPRDFVNEVKPECISGLSDEDREVLEVGPDHEWYWEAWQNVLNNAIVTAPDTGVQYRVDQDGDCWLVPVGMEFDDSRGYFWPDESDDREEEC